MVSSLAASASLQDRVLKSCQDPAARQGVKLLRVRPLPFNAFSMSVVMMCQTSLLLIALHCAVVTLG